MRLPKETIAGVQVALDPATFQRDAVPIKVTFEQLPNGLSPQFFEQKFQALQTRLESLESAKKSEVIRAIQVSSGASFDNLFANIVSDAFIKSLATIKGKDTDSVPTDLARFMALVKYLDAQPNEIPAGALLSPQEELLLKMSTSIRACPGGKKEGITLYYQNLPAEYKYDVKEDVNTPDAEKAVTYLKKGMQEMLSTIFSGNSALMKELTGFSGEIPQLAHVSIFVKNRIGSKWDLPIHLHLISTPMFSLTS